MLHKRMEVVAWGLLLCAAQAGCSRASCAGGACEAQAGQSAATPGQGTMRSERYRIELAGEATATPELRSASYRVRIAVDPTRLEGRR